jgi:recombination associated protein RdgC
MFKNITIYRIASGWVENIVGAYHALKPHAFAPCGPTQDRSVGWVPPRDGSVGWVPPRDGSVGWVPPRRGPLVESVGGQWILKLQIETKSVPGTVVRAHAKQAADDIEAQTGRKPGKKETKTLREDALRALLPQAFPRTSVVWVWIDKTAGQLVVDATGGVKLDTVITALVQTFDGLQLSLVQTNVTPATAMAQWLTAESPAEWPDEFDIERQCNLKSGDEEKAVVKFDRHNLCTPEIRQHIAEGKLPTSLALSYDGKVSFVLTETLALKKIKLLDMQADDSADAFDAEVALITGELRGLIPALIGALGGEPQPADPLFGE